MTSTIQIDKEIEKPNLSIEFTHLGNQKIFKEYIQSGIPKDSIQLCLKYFMTYKMGEYINAGDYDSLRKLEGVIELHNLIENIA